MPKRLLALGGGMVAIAAIAVAALTGTLISSQSTYADQQANQYSMEVIAPASAALNTLFVINTAIDFPGSGSGTCDGSSGVFGCYQASQWHVSFDNTVISAGSPCQPSCSQITTFAGAPGCTSETVTATNILVGCLSLAGADIDYAGNTFNITVQCIANGPGTFTVEEVVGPNTVSFVNDGATNQPIHTHTDTVTCGSGATFTPTNTPTDTSTPAPPTNTPTATRTPTPCPTTGCTTPTVAPRDTNTPTPSGSETPATGETPAGGETPGAGGTPGQPATSPPPSGTGGQGGTITGPDTGSGGVAEGSAHQLWIILGLTVAGAIAMTGGAVVRRLLGNPR